MLADEIKTIEILVNDKLHRPYHVKDESVIYYGLTNDQKVELVSRV